MICIKGSPFASVTHSLYARKIYNLLTLLTPNTVVTLIIPFRKRFHDPVDLLSLGGQTDIHQQLPQRDIKRVVIKAKPAHVLGERGRVELIRGRSEDGCNLGLGHGAKQAGDVDRWRFARRLRGLGAHGFRGRSGC